MDRNNLPQHIAIIMDGNGRWARRQGKPRSFGHQAGVDTVREITSECARMGIKFLTLYTFSTENWNRPTDEVTVLMGLVLKALEDDLFMPNNVRLRVVGDMSRLPDDVRDQLNATIKKTSVNTGMTMVLALSYSSRWELTNTMRTLAEKAKAGELDPASITEDTISENLATSFMPDPDLLIRTGGELRISNYLLWQIAYSELYFTDIYWPDFTVEHLHEAIADFQTRQRRYGKTGQQVEEQEEK